MKYNSDIKTLQLAKKKKIFFFTSGSHLNIRAPEHNLLGLAFQNCSLKPIFLRHPRPVESTTNTAPCLSVSSSFTESLLLVFGLGNAWDITCGSEANNQELKNGFLRPYA